MTSEEYEHHFATVSDGKLIDLVDNPADVDPNAVQMARSELARRGLNDAEMAVFRSARVEEAARNARTTARIESVGGRIGNAAREFRQVIMAGDDVPRTEKRQVLLLMLALGTIFLILTPRITYLNAIAVYGFEPDMLMYFLPLLLLPYTIYELWLRHARGWFLGTAFVCYCCASALAGAWLLVPVSLEPEVVPEDPLFQVLRLHDAPSFAAILLGVGVQLGLVYLFQMRRTTTIYNVTPALRWTAITLGTLVLAIELWSS